MRQFVATIFDDFVHGTTPVYSASFHEVTLASPHQIGIQAVTDSVGGTSVQLTVVIEASSDGRHWAAKSGTAVIDRASLGSSGTNIAVGTDSGEVPSGCLVRLKLFLEGTSPKAHVKLLVCGRGRLTSSRAPTAPPSACGCDEPALVFEHRGHENGPPVCGTVSSSEREALACLAAREPSMREVIEHALEQSPPPRRRSRART